MIRKQSRRLFIGQLIAASIGSSRAGATIGQFDVGLAELCVIARQPGTLLGAVIDVCTGQIGTLDLAQLPKHLGRGVVWDDIRGVRGLSQSIVDILLAIEEHFEIKPSLGSNAAAHVGHTGALSRSIEMLFNTSQPALLDAVGRRIAVVDLSSSGLTRLHWLDIIPLLRHYYTHVIGVDYSSPDLCELDGEFEPPHGLSGLARDTMRACDYWLLASDKLMFGRVDVSIEERSFEFTKSVHDLCNYIASAESDIFTAVSSFAKRQFAMFGARA
jgi:hypothetical protein